MIDDVDILTGQDRGFWQGVASLLETSKRPIILIGSRKNSFETGLNDRIHFLL